MPHFVFSPGGWHATARRPKAGILPGQNLIKCFAVCLLAALKIRTLVNARFYSRAEGYGFDSVSICAIRFRSTYEKGILTKDMECTLELATI